MLHHRTRLNLQYDTRLHTLIYEINIKLKKKIKKGTQVLFENLWERIFKQTKTLLKAQISWLSFEDIFKTLKTCLKMLLDSTNACLQ